MKLFKRKKKSEQVGYIGEEYPRPWLEGCAQYDAIKAGLLDTGMVINGIRICNMDLFNKFWDTFSRKLSRQYGFEEPDGVWKFLEDIFHERMKSEWQLEEKICRRLY